MPGLKYSMIWKGRKMNRCLVIAEAGVNHNGSLETAKKLVDAAKNAGADMVKFQAFLPQEVVSGTASMAPYQQQRVPAQSQLAMLEKLALTAQDFAALFAYCRTVDITFLATPFDLPSARMLEALGVTHYKVGSGELTNAPLIHLLAQTGKPVLLSCGMASLAEIREALGVLQHGYRRSWLPKRRWAFNALYRLYGVHGAVTLLHCVSSYPVPAGQANLRRIAQFRAQFGVPAGYSDHTQGIYAAVAAVAMGATVIEKHLTLDNMQSGPDHAVSLVPDQFRQMVEAIRDVEQNLQPYEGMVPCEQENTFHVRKSLVALANIAQGERFTEANLGMKRPEGGISPMDYWRWLGRKAPRSYTKEEQL
jgi:N-acetylneuraminate synthase